MVQSRGSDSDRARAAPGRTARRSESRASADRARARRPAGPAASIALNARAASAAVSGVPAADTRPGRNLTVYTRLSFEAVHDSASQGSSSSVLRLTRTSVAPVSRSEASAIKSVQPASDPPRGSAASIIASLLGGAGAAGDVSPAPIELARLVSHQIRKMAAPMTAAMANARYTRRDGASGLGLAKFRPTGQSVGHFYFHEHLHANLPLHTSSPAPAKSVNRSRDHNPANRLAAHPL